MPGTNHLDFSTQSSKVFHFPEPIHGDWGSKIPPTVSKEKVQDHLMKLKKYESLGPDGKYCRVLKELDDVVA